MCKIEMNDSLTTPHQMDSQFECLSITNLPKLPHVVIVSLNRPKKRNAINSKMWQEVGKAFRMLGTEGDDTRCVLLIGKGKSFCAGIDVTDPNFGFMDMMNDKDQHNQEDNDDDDGKSNSNIDIARKVLSFRPKILEMQNCLSAIEECPIPVVAAIHGSCIGGGIDLICCADIRICTPNTKFSVREAKLGLAADVGTLQRLPKIIGNSSIVRELCFTGSDFDGIEAERIGLVSRVSSDSVDDLMAAGLQICGQVAKNSPVAVSGTKLSLNYSRDHTVKDGLEHIAMYNAAALMTNDISTSFIASSTKSEAEFASLLPHAKL